MRALCESHAQTQAKRARALPGLAAAALPGLAAAAAQTKAMGLHTSDIPGVTVAAGKAAYHAGFGHGGAAAVAAAAVQAAAEAEAATAELMQHYAGPAAAVARGDVKEGHELLTALHDRLRADPTTRAYSMSASSAFWCSLHFFVPTCTFFWFSSLGTTGKACPPFRFLVLVTLLRAYLDYFGFRHSDICRKPLGVGGIPWGILGTP